MAINEHSFGLLYIAVVPTRSWFLPHLVGLVEEVPPWRRGRAVLFSMRAHQGVVFGVWRKPLGRHPLDDSDLDEEYWLTPDWLSCAPAEIGRWSRGPEAEASNNPAVFAEAGLGLFEQN
jgi:hypothetical protein